MENFGEGQPLFLFVDDLEQQPQQFAEAGKIVELSDVGCDAQIMQESCRKTVKTDGIRRKNLTNSSTSCSIGRTNDKPSGDVKRHAVTVDTKDDSYGNVCERIESDIKPSGDVVNEQRAKQSKIKYSEQVSKLKRNLATKEDTNKKPKSPSKTKATHSEGNSNWESFDKYHRHSTVGANKSNSPVIEKSKSEARGKKSKTEGAVREEMMQPGSSWSVPEAKSPEVTAEIFSIFEGQPNRGFSKIISSDPEAEPTSCRGLKKFVDKAVDKDSLPNLPKYPEASRLPIISTLNASKITTASRSQLKSSKNVPKVSVKKSSTSKKSVTNEIDFDSADDITKSESQVALEDIMSTTYESIHAQSTKKKDPPSKIRKIDSKVDSYHTKGKPVGKKTRSLSAYVHDPDQVSMIGSVNIDADYDVVASRSVNATPKIRRPLTPGDRAATIVREPVKHRGRSPIPSSGNKDSRSRVSSEFQEYKYIIGSPKVRSDETSAKSKHASGKGSSSSPKAAERAKQRGPLGATALMSVVGQSSKSSDKLSSKIPTNTHPPADKDYERSSNTEFKVGLNQVMQNTESLMKTYSSLKPQSDHKRQPADDSGTCYVKSSIIKTKVASTIPRPVNGRTYYNKKKSNDGATEILPKSRTVNVKSKISRSSNNASETESKSSSNMSTAGTFSAKLTNRIDRFAEKFNTTMHVCTPAETFVSSPKRLTQSDNESNHTSSHNALESQPEGITVPEHVGAEETVTIFKGARMSGATGAGTAVGTGTGKEKQRGRERSVPVRYADRTNKSRIPAAVRVRDSHKENAKENQKENGKDSQKGKAKPNLSRTPAPLKRRPVFKRGPIKKPENEHTRSTQDKALPSAGAKFAGKADVDSEEKSNSVQKIGAVSEQAIEPITKSSEIVSTVISLESSNLQFFFDETLTDQGGSATNSAIEESSTASDQLIDGQEKAFLRGTSIGLKVADMARAAKEELKREFVKRGFENRPTDKPKDKSHEIVDIGVSVIEKVLGESDNRDMLRTQARTGDVFQDYIDGRPTDWNTGPWFL